MGLSVVFHNHVCEALRFPLHAGPQPDFRVPLIPVSTVFLQLVLGLLNLLLGVLQLRFMPLQLLVHGLSVRFLKPLLLSCEPILLPLHLLGSPLPGFPAIEHLVRKPLCIPLLRCALGLLKPLLGVLQLLSELLHRLLRRLQTRLGRLGLFQIGVGSHALRPDAVSQLRDGVLRLQGGTLRLVPEPLDFCLRLCFRLCDRVLKRLGLLVRKCLLCKLSSHPLDHVQGGFVDGLGNTPLIRIHATVCINGIQGLRHRQELIRRGRGVGGVQEPGHHLRHFRKISVNGRLLPVVRDSDFEASKVSLLEIPEVRNVVSVLRADGHGLVPEVLPGVGVILV